MTSDRGGGPGDAESSCIPPRWLLRSAVELGAPQVAGRKPAAEMPVCPVRPSWRRLRECVAGREVPLHADYGMDFSSRRARFGASGREGGDTAADHSGATTRSPAQPAMLLASTKATRREAEARGRNHF